MRAVGLFAGIGGIELGLCKAGHDTLLLCENDPGAAAVLDARFPSVPRVDDVRALDSLPVGTELLAAGFPCQDLSQAGGTRGIRGARSGLVGEVFRLLEGRRVPWVLLENVPFMLQLNRGAAMDFIVTRFERLGYRWAYRVIDTRAFGLPQRRERVFFLASLEEDPAPRLMRDSKVPAAGTDHRGHACGFYWTEGVRGLGWAVAAVPTLKGGSTVGIPSPPAIWLPNGRIVTPDIRDAERLQGFPVDWTKPAERVGRSSFRWKLVGNAVTVRVAKWVGERLAEPARGVADDLVVSPLTGAWPRAAFGDASGGRFCVDATTWPVSFKQTPVDEFLLYEPKELSLRATSGFERRLASSSLRAPDAFRAALKTHIQRMAGA
ncbi:MAG: DNA (cytosine-5-)-methyltransferase [Planctomycetes bacterium]|nr:DNA (cytosine-5-)-methyltransferase [Planctomycetota bacterium]